MCPITINKALLLQEGILKFELSWTAVIFNKIFGNKFYKITANELNVASFKDNLRIILSERAEHER